MIGCIDKLNENKGKKEFKKIPVIYFPCVGWLECVDCWCQMGLKGRGSVSHRDPLAVDQQAKPQLFQSLKASNDRESAKETVLSSVPL